MFNKLKQIIKETAQNIKSDKRAFIVTISTMVVVFLIFNFFIVYIMNLNKLNSYVKENMKMKIYLEDNLTETGITNLEKNLLSYKQIEKIQYISKKMALKELSEKMEIDVNYADNPLKDILLLTINGEEELQLLKENLAKELGVLEVEEKSGFIKKLFRFTKELQNIAYFLLIIIGISIFFLIFKLTNHTIYYRKKEIKLMSLLGASRGYIKMQFILENIIAEIIALFLSLIIFIKSYDFIQSGLEEIIPIFKFVTTNEILLLLIIIVFGLGSIITVVATIISIKIFLNLSGE